MTFINWCYFHSISKINFIYSTSRFYQSLYTSCIQPPSCRIYIPRLAAINSPFLTLRTSHQQTLVPSPSPSDPSVLVSPAQLPAPPPHGPGAPDQYPEPGVSLCFLVPAIARNSPENRQYATFLCPGDVKSRSHLLRAHSKLSAHRHLPVTCSFVCFDNSNY